MSWWQLRRRRRRASAQSQPAAGAQQQGAGDERGGAAQRSTALPIRRSPHSWRGAERCDAASSTSASQPGTAGRSHGTQTAQPPPQPTMAAAVAAPPPARLTEPAHLHACHGAVLQRDVSSGAVALVSALQAHAEAGARHRHDFSAQPVSVGPRPDAAADGVQGGARGLLAATATHSSRLGAGLAAQGGAGGAGSARGERWVARLVGTRLGSCTGVALSPAASAQRRWGRRALEA